MFQLPASLELFVVHFRLSATLEGDNYDGSFYFLVDNVKITFSDGTSPNSNREPEGSATINLHLTAGQLVQVQNYVTTTVFGTESIKQETNWLISFGRNKLP